MSRNVYFVLLFVLVAVGIAQASRGSSVPASDAWQYKILQTYDPSFKGVQTLNELGLQGWELVAVSSNGSESAGVQYVLKRRVSG